MTLRRKALLVRSALLSPVLLMVSLNAAANPTGGVVAQGQATFNTQGSTLTITNSPSAVINWQSFSIGAGSTTNFVQQSASSAVLNRVVGQNPSNIAGSLRSNGRVFLVNPNGALFTASAQINTAAFTVSTSNISDADFLAGNRGWSGSGSFFSVEGPMSGALSITAISIDVTGSLNAPGGLTINSPQNVNVGLVVNPLVTGGGLVITGGNPTSTVMNTIVTGGTISTTSGNITLTSDGSANGAITTPGATGTTSTSGGGIVTVSGTGATNGANTAGAQPALVSTSSPNPTNGVAPTGISLAGSALTTSAARSAVTATGTTSGGSNTVALVSLSTNTVSTSSAVAIRSAAAPRPAGVAIISLQKREPLF